MDDNLATICLLTLAAILLLLERFAQFGRDVAPIQNRWATNVGLILAGSLVITNLFPATVVQVAGDIPTGIVNDLQLPLALEAALLFLLLDCWYYWQHRIFHEVPLLWRTHLVHHSDTALDITTSRRHHPIEGIIVTVMAFILIFALGISAEALGIYLFASILSSLWTHTNINLPEAIDKPLRSWLVTPAVHAMHHSSYQPETDSNYGAVLTIWDRMFGTYTPPVDKPIRFGLEYFRDSKDSTLMAVLLQPFTYSRNGLNHRADMKPHANVGQQNIQLSPAWRQAILYMTVGLAMTLPIMWPTILDLGRLWTEGDAGAYQYAWLVLPMFIYLLGWYHRDSILAMTPRPGLKGLPLALLALALWAAALITDFKLGQQLALVIMLQAIALCALGRKTYWKLLPTMLLLFLMVPCGDLIQPLLRDLTVKWLEWFAILFGLSHTVDGYFISFGENDYVIVEACSGLAFFALAGFVGYCCGLMLYRSLPKVLAMAALGAALGILTNALRVCLIVTIDLLRGTQMDLAGHEDIQWLVLALSLGMLLFLAGKLQRDNWNDSTKLTSSPA